MFNFLDCHKRRNPGVITFCWRLEVKVFSDYYYLISKHHESQKILLLGWEEREIIIPTITRKQKVVTNFIHFYSIKIKLNMQCQNF